MKIKEYRSYFINEIALVFDFSEAESFFYIILHHLHQLKRIDLALNPDLEISANQLLRWDEILNE